MSTKKIKLNIVSKDSEKDSEGDTIPPPPPTDDESSDNEEDANIPKTPSATPPPTPETPIELLKEMDEKEKMMEEDSGNLLQPTTPDTPPEILQQLEEKKVVKKKKEYTKQREIFMPIIGETNLILPLKSVGKNLKEKISKNLSVKLEGKCNGDGFVKSGSVKVTTYSNGLLTSGDVKYKIVYEAYVCNPVEGHKLECIVNNVTKAGIRASVIDGEDTPLIIFIARDHHYNDSNFLSVKEGDNITVRVVGSRFELNDTYIAIIGELVKQKKPRLKIVN
jgi:DNA-directed RNA polymerase subunit E'/Rpb7